MTVTVIGDIGIAGTGVKRSPEPFPPATYTGEYDIESVTLVIAVTMVVTVVAAPSYTARETVYVAVMVVCGIGHWGKISLHGGRHETSRCELPGHIALGSMITSEMSEPWPTIQQLLIQSPCKVRARYNLQKSTDQNMVPPKPYLSAKSFCFRFQVSLSSYPIQLSLFSPHVMYFIMVFRSRTGVSPSLLIFC